MTTSFVGLKEVLDLPEWESVAFIYTAASAALTAGAGSTLIDDKRLSAVKAPNMWFLQSATVLSQYNKRANGFIQLSSPALAGTFGAGATGVFAPSQGPRGTIAAGATTTSITLSAVLPNSATVQANQLKGLRIRIIGNNAAGSGKVEEVTIAGNTAGTTPTIYFESALTFTPGTGAAYELLSGRVFIMSAGTLAAGIIKYFDVGTTTYNTSAIATTNMPATIGTDSVMVSLDELHTPILGYNGAVINGEVGGYFGTLTATGSGATSLTGQAASGDATVAANEFRNFQIRIVEDTTTPTAVGQRRRITSHTAGASPVYTVPAWTVTPSANAKYMIEHNNDIIMWSSASTTTYRFDPVALAWDTTTYAVRSGASSNGVTAWHPFNRAYDANKKVNWGTIFTPRGGGTNVIDMLDITAATTGTWTGDIAYDNKGLTLFNTGGCSAYEGISNKTIIRPIGVASVGSLTYSFDNDTLSLRPYYQCPFLNSTAVNGEKMGTGLFYDGTDKKGFVYFIPDTTSVMLRSLIFV